MKKFIKAIVIALLTAIFAITAFGCGNNDKTIVVGASATPHAEILEQIKDDLKAEGWTLEIKIYDDYVLPNTALDDGELDANFFQHDPYLNDFNKENGTKISSVFKVHYEPFGLYGVNNTTKTGRKILLPNDGSNQTRALLLLQEQGYITLREGVTASDILTTLDIVNTNGNTITPMDADLLPATLKAEGGETLAAINGNYALQAQLTGALAYESSTGSAATTYGNIIAVKEGNEQSEKTLALIKALKTKKVADYINNTYNGAVQPVFTVA